MLVGIAVGAAPSPDGLVLSDPASSCLGYGAVTLWSIGSGRSYLCRAFIYYLINESSKNLPHLFFFTDSSGNIMHVLIHKL